MKRLRDWTFGEIHDLCKERDFGNGYSKCLARFGMATECPFHGMCKQEGFLPGSWAWEKHLQDEVRGRKLRDITLGECAGSCNDLDCDSCDFLDMCDEVFGTGNPRTLNKYLEAMEELPIRPVMDWTALKIHNYCSSLFTDCHGSYQRCSCVCVLKKHGICMQAPFRWKLDDYQKEGGESNERGDKTGRAGARGDRAGEETA